MGQTTVTPTDGSVLQEREAERARVRLVMLGEMPHLHLHALPGMGTTSLLRAAVEDTARQTGHESVPAYDIHLPPVEKERQVSGSSVETGRYLVAARVWESVEAKEPAPSVEHPWFEVLGQALGRVRSRGKATLVIENVDQSQMAGDPTLAEAFMSGAKRAEARVITTASRTAGVQDVGLAELLRNANVEPQFLMPLSEEGTRQMVATAAPGVDASAAGRIYERTGGWPGLIARACSVVVDERFAEMNEDEWQDRLGTVSQSLLARAYAALTERERESVLWLCASESIAENEAASDAVVRDLHSKGILIRRKAGLRFITELLQRYVAPMRSPETITFHVVDQLQPMQLRLYRCLLEDVNHHVSWRRLCHAAWGTLAEKSKEDLRPQMSYLRKALARADRGTGSAGIVPPGQADSYALLIRDREWAGTLRAEVAARAEP